MAAGGVDVVAIATLINKPEGDLITRPEIKKAEELRGKTVAIQSIGGGGWANNMLALDYLGLDPDRDKINFLVLGDQASRIQALETGRAQASWMGLDVQRAAQEKRLHGLARPRQSADSLSRLIVDRPPRHLSSGAKAL